jgi:hypothetical protein
MYKIELNNTYDTELILDNYKGIWLEDGSTSSKKEYLISYHIPNEDFPILKYNENTMELSYEYAEEVLSIKYSKEFTAESFINFLNKKDK